MGKIIQKIKDWWRETSPLLGGVSRSSQWPAVRKANIKKECECCGKKGTFLNPLELHHIELFSQAPKKELLPSNFLTACRDCHYLLCHLRDWKSWDKDIRKNAAELLTRIKNRP